MKVVPIKYRSRNTQYFTKPYLKDVDLILVVLELGGGQLDLHAAAAWAVA